MTEPADAPDARVEPSHADAVRAEIATTREELARAAELLAARMARRTAAAQQAAQRAAAPSAAPSADDVDHRDPPARVEVLPAPGRNLPATRSWMVQPQSVAIGALLAVVVYLLTRRRR